MRRPGISRVAVEIVLLLNAVALAVLIVSPIGGYLMSSMARVHGTTGSKYGVQIISVNPRGIVHSSMPGNPCNGGTALIVFIKNIGSQEISQGEWERSFQIFVKNSSGTYMLTTNCWIDCEGPGCDYNWAPGFQPGEVWILYFPSGVQNPSQEFSVIIYGPEGTSSMYIYVPH